MTRERPEQVEIESLRKEAQQQDAYESARKIDGLGAYKRARAYLTKSTRPAPRRLRFPFTKIKVPLSWNTLATLWSTGTTDGLLLASSPLFDSIWYLNEYPDVAATGINPICHYLRHGAAEGRDPSAAFESDWYLSKNPDVAAAKLNPLCHYLRQGYKEGLLPNRLFEPRWYLEQNPDVAKAQIEPLFHYLSLGAAEGRDPHPDFCTVDYLGRHPDVAAAGMNPIVHCLRYGGCSVPGPMPRDVALTQKAGPTLIQKRGSKVANRLGPRILMIDTVFPRPDRDSGSLTSRYLVEIFLSLGWQVTFVADAEIEGGNAYSKQLEDIGVCCAYRPDVSSIEDFLIAEGASFALCMLFRVCAGGRHFESVRRFCPNAKIVFETVDLHFLREERAARLHNDQKALNQAYAVRARETYVARQSDTVIVVSDFEHQLLERELPDARPMTLPLILECPGRKSPFSDRNGICFLGGYLHQPNIDAVLYFIDEVWPLVLARLPLCKFSIVGSDLPDVLRAKASDNILAVGYVKDLDAYLNTTRLTVAPLRYGAGVKGKIGSSLANGVPCVASIIAAEGMGLGIDEGIAIADDPLKFVECIARLYEDEAMWNRMSDAGWRHASRHFSVHAGGKRIATMLRSLGLPVAWTESSDHGQSRSIDRA